MKNFLVVLSLFATVSALACPNYSGKYIDEDGEVFTMNQTDCVTVSWTDTEGTKQFIADGSEHVMKAEGRITAYATATMLATKMKVKVRMDYGGIEIPDGYPDQFDLEFFLDKKQNLVEKIQYSGKTEYLTYLKQP